MINVNELRLGNFMLQKLINKIATVKCGYLHFELIAKEGTKNLYPVVLKAEILEQCGFVENKEYALLPGARQFILPLAVIGSSKNELHAFIKTNQECFGRSMVNGMPASNNFYQLHQLQNLYFSLTGEELPVKLHA